MFLKSTFTRKFIALAFTTACLLAAGTVFAQAAVCDSSTDYTAEGDRLAEEGDYAAAADAYYCALENDRRNPQLLLAHAESLTLSDHFLEAISSYALLADFYPDILQARLDELREQVGEEPDNLEALWLLANASYRLNNPDEAVIADVQRFLDATPDDPGALMMMATTARLNSEGYDAMNPLVLRAFEVAGDEAEMRGVIGWFEATFGTDVETGLLYMEESLEMEPNNPIIHWAQGDVLSWVVGDYEAAGESYLRGMEVSPYDYWLNDSYLYLVGTGLIDADEADVEAIAERYEAIIPPEYQTAFLLRSYAFIGVGNEVRAAEIIAEYADSLSDGVVDDDALAAGDNVEIATADGVVFRYELEASAGDTLTILVEDPEGETDPVLAILAPDGSGLAANDDINTMEGNPNSEITFTASEEGTYTLLVTYWDYSAGDFEVTVSEG